MNRTAITVLVIIAMLACAGFVFTAPVVKQGSSGAAYRFTLQAGAVLPPSTEISLVGSQLEGSNPNVFVVSSLTLTGLVTEVSPIIPAQTLAELKWRIQAALDSKDYRKALEYASADLVGSPEEQMLLLKAKAVAYAKLGRLPDAIATLQYVSIMDPLDFDAVDNIAELLLLTGQVEEYRAFVAKHKDHFAVAYDGFLMKYFSALEAYQTDDMTQFRQSVTSLLQSLPVKKEPLLAEWSFSQLLATTALQPPSRKKAVLMTYVSVFMGDIDSKAALAHVNDL